MIVFGDNEGAWHSKVSGVSTNDGDLNIVSDVPPLRDSARINPRVEHGNICSNPADASSGASHTLNGWTNIT